MPRSVLASLIALALLAGSVLAADEKSKPDTESAKPRKATITHVDARKGAITIKYTDEQGKPQEKKFQLTGDVRLLDETGHVVTLDVFESGSDALVVEREGRLRELRRAPHLGRLRRLSDSIRTLVEMGESDPAAVEDLQRIYDELRKLDTSKNGKIDPNALKAEADNILQERVNAVFNRLDTNKDGKISRDEAHGLIKEHFDRIDTNKDGFIEKDELMKAAKEHREHTRRDGDAKPKENK